MEKKKKKNGYQEFMEFVDELIHKLLVLMMIIVIGCVVLQIIGRYIKFIKPFSWTEEIARWLLVWLTFLGATHIAASSSYTRVDFFVKKFNAKTQRIIGVFNKICMLIFTGYFAYKSLVVFTTVSVNERGPATQLPMLIVRSAVFVGMAITFLQMIAAGGIFLETPEEEESSV